MRALRCVVAASVLCSVASVDPMERLKTITGRAFDSAATGTDGASQERGSDVDRRLEAITKSIKEGVDVVSFFTEMVQSEAVKVMMRSPEIQRRLVDHMPLLGALKGFDKIAQGPLSDQESTSAFVEGLDTSLTFLKDAVSRMQNPESAADPKAALEVAKEHPGLVTRARQGDKEAFDQVNTLINEKMHPGLNTTAFKEAALKVPTLPEVLELEGLGPLMAHFVDADPVMRSIARQPVDPQRLVDRLQQEVRPSTAFN